MTIVRQSQADDPVAIRLPGNFGLEGSPPDSSETEGQHQSEVTPRRSRAVPSLARPSDRHVLFSTPTGEAVGAEDWLSSRRRSGRPKPAGPVRSEVVRPPPDGYRPRLQPIRVLSATGRAGGGWPPIGAIVLTG